MKYTHRSGNRFSTTRIANFLGFKIGFKICQDGHLLVNSGRSSKAFNITNVGVPRTWILLEGQYMINFFCNHKLLTEAVHMEVFIDIHCNLCTFCTSLAVMIPGFEEEKTRYHQQRITNVISLYLDRKYFHIK